MQLESCREKHTLVITTGNRRRRCCRRFFPLSLESFRKLITLVTTTGNRRRCCRSFFSTVVLLLLVATDAARELSSENDKATLVPRIRNGKKIKKNW
jgi:hypothetical protein